MKSARLSAALSLALSACRPEFDDRDWLIDSVRLLAVKSEPPEAKPGETVHFTALLSSPNAAAGAPDLDWRFCSAPKRLTENNAVSSSCLSANALEEAGRGLTIDAPTPLNGCALFGPDTPPGDFRPRDPDSTGGYFQPLRVDVPGTIPAFHLQRISCGLAEASADTARAFALAYVRNHNPTLAEVAARSSG
ncbi:MAG: hypothetical protein ABIQ16_04665, partial [Polyangiaceae bacterium]